jgi:pimeloyl-ACP methyl ester carboxylesterase
MYFENKLGKVYYEVYGRDDAPAVLFSHGINMNHETFKAQAEGFQHKYKVIIWDMPYHGKSSPICKKLPFSETTADLIIDLLDHLKIEKAVLAGLSLGSYVTQIAAHKYPEKVKATVHIGGGPLHPAVTPLIKIFNPLIGLFIKLYPSNKIFKAFASHRTLKPETRAYMERVAAENGKNVMAHLTQELMRDMVRGLPRHTNEPKLLCHGDHEIAFVQKQMNRWHKECPESRLAIIENAHHIANQDNPEETNKVQIDFLDMVLG